VDPETAPPSEQAETTHSRRRFLRWLGGLAVVSTAAMIVTPVIGFLVPSKGGAAAGGGKVLVGTTADIPAGAGKVVAMGSKPAIVVNTDQGVKAFSAICTHLGCVVAWNDMIGAIQCPCHDGRFNPTTGAVVSGPPPNPLPPISVSVEGDQIYLTEA
jgi:Rieske Fe-S protein